MARQRQADSSNIAPWRRDIPAGFRETIAKKQPFGLEPLKDYMLCGNSAVAGMVADHIARHGTLIHPHPRNGGYDIALKECTDARAVAYDLDFLLKYGTIHARTAGSVVRNGAIFKSLKQGGLAVVSSHRTCGATAAAHSLIEQEKPEGVDVNVFSIVTTIPYYVRAMPDHAKRDPENAKAQAFFARRVLKAGKRDDIYVFPSYLDWSAEEPFNWLRHKPEHPCARMLARSAKRMTEYALAEGRNFDGNPAAGEPAQYAAAILLYDPYRMGRVSDPRAFIGALGNEFFCVSADMRSFDPSKEARKYPSATAMGSVMYAGFDKSNGHYGHVAGVGGHDGTHILGIIDTCEQALINAKRYLLETYPLIKELTEQGQRIMLIHFDRDTAKIRFIQG